MTELGDLAPPIVSAATRLHGHRAGRQRGQEREQLAPAQLLTKDHRTRAVGPMKLKDVLGEIESDGANLVHGRLLKWALTPPLWHAEAVGGVHTIRPLKGRQGRKFPPDSSVEGIEGRERTRRLNRRERRHLASESSLRDRSILSRGRAERWLSRSAALAPP